MAATIVLVNRSTVLTDAEASAPLAALQAQVTSDWLPHWPGRDATLAFAGLKDPVPADTWPLYLLDHTDTPGAGGYHDDDQNLPQGKAFVADAMQVGEEWTVDVSHELLEMLGDPQTDTLITLQHKHWRCLQEVCDAVEADQYGYHRLGILLSDFCLPAYFSGAPGPYDFNSRLHHPAPALLVGGYLGIELPNGHWTQLTDYRLTSRRATNAWRLKRRLNKANGIIK